MIEPAIGKPKRNTTAENEATFVQLMSEIDRLEEHMVKVASESERIKAETQVIKAHTDRSLSLLGEQMKVVTRVL